MIVTKYSITIANFCHSHVLAPRFNTVEIKHPNAKSDWRQSYCKSFHFFYFVPNVFIFLTLLISKSHNNCQSFFTCQNLIPYTCETCYTQSTGKCLDSLKTNQWTASSYSQSINLSYLSLCHKDVLSRIVLTYSPIINTCRKKRHDSSLTFRTIMSEFPQLFRRPFGTNQTRNHEDNEHRSWSSQHFFSVFEMLYVCIQYMTKLFSCLVKTCLQPIQPQDKFVRQTQQALFLPIILVFGATSSF